MATINEAPIVRTKSAAANSAPASTDIFETLPDDVKSLPVVKWLAIGEPPAVRLEPGQYFPELEPIGRQLPSLLEGGLDAFKAASGDLVLFNPLFIDAKELSLADESGKLPDIVPSYSELTGSNPEAIPDDKFNSMLDEQDRVQAGLNALNVPDETTGPAGANLSPAISELTAGGQVSAPPPPAPAQTRIATQRLQQLSPGGPTTGAQPGAGRLLNGLTKRAV